MARPLTGRTCRPTDDDELELVLVAFTLVAVLDQTVTTVEPLLAARDRRDVGTGGRIRSRTQT